MKTSIRQRDSFDFDWKFNLDDPADAKDPALDDSKWQDVQLPHDWSIALQIDEKAPAWGSGGWFPGGVGWYRKSFDVSGDEAGKVFWIEFDGIYHNSDVWLNSQHLGRRAYGYSSFHYDLTPHLKPGARNVIAVRVDNSDQPNCRWYSGSGIYRHAWLTKTSGAARAAHWGAHVTTSNISRESADVRICTSIETSSPGVAIETTIFAPDGSTVGSARSGKDFDQTIRIKSPLLWSAQKPDLYVARTVVLVEGKPVDDYITTFGIRDIRFDKDRGFLVNGAPVKLKGVCLHHDGGAVGAAVPDRVLERRLQILKDLGCNAIRCAHNPPSPEVLDFCDKMGLFVIDEAFDKWAGAFSKPNEWWMRQRDFDANWEQDLRAMLQRDHNHPSIILWSVGNETGQPGTDQVDPTLEKLVEVARREEPSRPVTAALVNSNAHTREERIARIVKCAKLVDVLALNYQEPMYEHIRAADPNLVIVGSETFKYFRGGEMNVHSFEPINPWWDVLKHDYVVGSFLWPGIDYLGESTKFPNKGWATGILDTCGFLRPEAWFFRSAWRPGDPVVRIGVFDDSIPQEITSWGSPLMKEHWNWPGCEGKLLRLQTQTNCQTVELIVNGKSMGTRKARDYRNNAIEWFVPYQPGSVEAIARNESSGTGSPLVSSAFESITTVDSDFHPVAAAAVFGGFFSGARPDAAGTAAATVVRETGEPPVPRIVARHELRTAGPTAKIALVADRAVIRADGQDVSHIEVRLEDDAGVLVPDDRARIEISLEGAGRLLALDSGDLSDAQPFQSPVRTARDGRCLAIVQSSRRPGIIKLTARSGGLAPATVEIAVK